jgi:hypothetical protein
MINYTVSIDKYINIGIAFQAKEKAAKKKTEEVK